MVGQTFARRVPARFMVLAVWLVAETAGKQDGFLGSCPRAARLHPTRRHKRIFVLPLPLPLLPARLLTTLTE